MDTRTSMTTQADYSYPMPAPLLELPSSQPTRFPTLQRAGAFLKQAHSPLAYDSSAMAADGVRRSLPLGGAASPTSPSAVVVASSFLASIRRGLDDLAHDDDDESDDDDADDSPRYYAGSSENTYYAPPSAFEAFDAPPSHFQLPTRTSARDEELIFDMEM